MSFSRLYNMRRRHGRSSRGGGNLRSASFACEARVQFRRAKFRRPCQGYSVTVSRGVADGTKKMLPVTARSLSTRVDGSATWSSSARLRSVTSITVPTTSTKLAENGMTHHVDVSNLAAGMNDSVIELELRLLAPRCLGCFPNFGLIIRMDALKECFKSRLSTVRVKTQHAVAFLGPVPNITRSGDPGPTARMAEPLRFC